MMAIVVRGATCSLGEAVVDRLLSMDIDVVAVEKSHQDRNSDLLNYSDVNVFSEGDGFSISFDGSKADLMIGTQVIVHDLIPSRADKWLTGEVKEWISLLSNGEEIPIEGPSRYWLSVLDAADGIVQLARTETRVENMHMCGRREWEAKDTIAELKMLWERTIQGISGNFTPETLFGHSIAGMEVKPITLQNNERPNLEPLHNQLIALGTDGWRPLIPLRIAIMSLLAGILAE
jgi:nucleoside-diphosphate-sugar epimerase